MQNMTTSVMQNKKLIKHPVKVNNLTEIRRNSSIIGEISIY